MQIVRDAVQADRSPNTSPVRPHPLWSDFAPAGGEPACGDTACGDPIGWDPAGAEVRWDPETDGYVLTVLLAAADEHVGLTALVDRLRDKGVTVVCDSGDPAQRAAADAAASARRPVCLVSGGAHSPPGASSAAGPTLLLGPWSENSLRMAGHRNLAPIPHDADAYWWIAGGIATPIRLRSQDHRRRQDSPPHSSESS